MPTKKKKIEDPLKKEFLVRLLDQGTAELVSEALEKGLYPNRNKLVNECIVGHLTRVSEKVNPTETLTALFNKHMDAYDWKIKRQLDDLKKLMLVMSTELHFDDKAIGFIIALLENALGSNTAFPSLPQASIESGYYDRLPDRLNAGKQKALSDVLDNSVKK